MAGRTDLETLVERARDGSSTAWGKIYEALAPTIYRLCSRVLPTSQDAEDATSEIFLKARLRLARYDGERPFAPWLYRLAANHCWDELRKRRRRGEWADDADGEVEALEHGGPSPQDAVLANEDRRAVREAVAELDDRARMAVALRYFAELSYGEIAEVLGISVNFVGVILLRARRQMRRRLQER